MNDAVNSRYSDSILPSEGCLTIGLRIPCLPNLKYILFGKFLSMICLMFSICDNFQVGGIIIQAISVEMMDMFAWVQRASQYLFHDIAMFKYTPTPKNIDATTLLSNTVLGSFPFRNVQNMIAVFFGCELFPMSSTRFRQPSTVCQRLRPSDKMCGAWPARNIKLDQAVANRVSTTAKFSRYVLQGTGLLNIGMAHPFFAIQSIIHCITSWLTLYYVGGRMSSGGASSLYTS